MLKAEKLDFSRFSRSPREERRDSICQSSAFLLSFYPNEEVETSFGGAPYYGQQNGGQKTNYNLPFGLIHDLVVRSQRNFRYMILATYRT